MTCFFSPTLTYKFYMEAITSLLRFGITGLIRNSCSSIAEKLIQQTKKKESKQKTENFLIELNNNVLWWAMDENNKVFFLINYLEITVLFLIN